MPLQATSGAASYDAFGGGVAAVPNYIEDVFSTYLYTGNGSTQTITNGIDLSTKGGLVWIKRRDGAGDHTLTDTVRGASNVLYSNATSAQSTDTQAGAYSYLSSGFDVYSASGFGTSNRTGATYASWTFRKQPKFFDVVTTTSQTVSHSLASVAGFVIWKRTDASEDWNVLARKSDGSYVQLNLNLTDGAFASYANASAAGITSTNITLPSFTTGGTYVVYLYAHDAGGFGLTGTDNVISCGSYTGSSNTPQQITLGYEPQWVLLKKSSTIDSWRVFDNMRGMALSTGGNAILEPNTSSAESASSNWILPNATGFVAGSSATDSATYIYIAIRRGPMKVPTSGTSVFAPFYASYSEGAAITTNFPIDLSMWKGNVTYNWSWQDRLRGTPTSTGSGGPALASNSTAAETTSYTGVGISKLDSNTGGSVSYQADSGRSNAAAYFMLRRAPSFFDEVCWTRSTTTATLNHNLGVVPELIIKKVRSRAGTYWDVMPNVSPYDYRYDIYLNDTQAISGPSSIYWNAAPTATTFDVHMGFDGSSNGDTFVAYLFATCAGVSKVGSYTGNGSTQQIDCGFTGGARFVMIKQTSGSGGDWYVYSSALGIVAGSDRTVLFNSSNASSAFGDTLDALSSGFELGPDSSSFGNNTNGATYIYLAIA